MHVIQDSRECFLLVRGWKWFRPMKRTTTGLVGFRARLPNDKLGAPGHRIAAFGSRLPWRLCPELAGQRR